MQRQPERAPALMRGTPQLRSYRGGGRQNGDLVMAAITPRAVFVVRATDYEDLIARHATRGQARFFLESRGEDLGVIEARHARFHAALARARASTPS